MCFAGGPGLYSPGECGARLEACLHMTAQDPKLIPVWRKSLEAAI
jgi:Xaa-Pro aminopeptidase